MATSAFEPISAFQSIVLDSLKEELQSDRNKPNAHWDNRNLLNAYAAFVYSNRENIGNEFDRARGKLLWAEILYRMGG